MGCAASSPLVVLGDQPDIHNNNSLNHLNVSTPPSSVRQPAAPPNTSVSNSSRRSSVVTNHNNGDDAMSFGGLRGVLFRSTKSAHSNHHQALTTYFSDAVAPTKAPPTHSYNNKDLHGVAEGPHSALFALVPSAFSSAHRVPGGVEDASQFYSGEDPLLVPRPPSRDVIMASGVSAPGSCSARRSNGRRSSVGFDEFMPFSPLTSAEENIGLIGRGELPFGGSSSTSRRRGSTGSGTGRLPLPQLPRLPIAPMPQQDAFQNCRRMSENDNINENVVHEETEDEEDTPSEQTRRRGETDEGFLNNHTNVVALPQLVIHPAFVVAEANLFKPRNPLEPDSPISVHNSNANNFGGNPPHQGEEEQLRAPPPAVPTTYQQPPQQHESELRPHAPSNQQCRVTTRPFFRTILVQEEARAAELAAAAHPSAPSPPPLARASVMPSSSSRQLMFNQSFVPLKLMTSGSTLDKRQAQSLVSDEIGAASFASW